MSQIIPIYIPNYISNAQFAPARVLPRIFFYNGQVECETFWVKNESNSAQPVTAFPYFDNYSVVSGSFPTDGSKSLLFNNEAAVYGTMPSASLYSEYWDSYISLLYNPKTRLVTAKAIIPLAEYVQMELNDVVNFRGNYFHLRAINDYSLKDSTCQLQLLGPIIPDTFYIPPPPPPTPPTTASVSWTNITDNDISSSFRIYDNGSNVVSSSTTQGGSLFVSQSHVVNVELNAITGSWLLGTTMSINVNGGATIATTTTSDTTITASFTIAGGVDYFITGSTSYNITYVSGAKVIFDFGNPASYPGSGSLVTNIGTGGSTFNGTLVNTPTYLASNGGVMQFASSSFEYLEFSSSLSASFTTMALIKHNASTSSWGTGANSYSGWPNIRGDNGFILTNDTDGTTRVLNILWYGSSTVVPAANFIYPANIGIFHSYAYTSNGTNEHKMYLDTGSAATSTNTYTRGDSALMASYIGRDVPNSGYLNGEVMAYLQYDRVLSAAELQQNYEIFAKRF